MQQNFFFGGSGSGSRHIASSFLCSINAEQEVRGFDERLVPEKHMEQFMLRVPYSQDVVVIPCTPALSRENVVLGDLNLLPGRKIAPPTSHGLSLLVHATFFEGGVPALLGGITALVRLALHGQMRESLVAHDLSFGGLSVSFLAVLRELNEGCRREYHVSLGSARRAERLHVQEARRIAKELRDVGVGIALLAGKADPIERARDIHIALPSLSQGSKTP